MKRLGRFSSRAFSAVGVLGATALSALAMPLDAQAPDMALAMVAGKRYERRSFGTDGELDGVQRIEVGGVERVGEYVEVEVLSRAFNPDGTPGDTVRTSIRCRPREAGMIMDILALVHPEGRSVRVRLEGGEVLYPPDAGTGTLAPVTLEARVEEGVLGFLGGRSRIVLTGRTVDAADGPPGSYRLRSRLELQFFVLGVRVRSKRFEVVETVESGAGLQRQVLTAEDGSFVSLTRED